MKQARGCAGMALLALGLCVVAVRDNRAADDKGGIPITEADLKKLVKATTENVQKALAAGKDKKSVAKARVAAVMIAAYAQHAKAGAVRDAALKLADAVKAGKLDEAKKQAEALAGLKIETAGTLAAVPLLKPSQTAIGEVMRQFASPGDGGYGIEAQLKKLTSSKKLSEAQMGDDFVHTAFLLAAIGDLLKEAPPAKNAKDFQKLADELRSLGALLAEQSKSKNGAASAATLYKLTIQCNKCHDKFKD